MTTRRDEDTVSAEKLLGDAASRMDRSVEVLKRELNSVRTGRASTALVENVMVDYYGVPTPLNQLATISAPEAQLLLIQPWDKKAVQGIERAILKSTLGLNPANDGNIIRVPIPPLSQERRQELVRVLGKKMEESKVAVRNVRRDVLERLRALEKNKSISQDEDQRAQTQLQRVTDAHIAQVEQTWQAKVSDIMEM